MSEAQCNIAFVCEYAAQLIHRILIVEIDMRRLQYETFHISQDIYFEMKLFWGM